MQINFREETRVLEETGPNDTQTPLRPVEHVGGGVRALLDKLLARLEIRLAEQHRSKPLPIIETQRCERRDVSSSTSNSDTRSHE